MHETYRIAYRDDHDEAALDVIGPGIHFFNRDQAGDGRHQRLCFALYAPDDAIVGGLVGDTSWGWLHVDLLWIREDLRGQGYGRQLLAQAEDEARRRGVKHAFLDTFGFQAPAFYQKQGYVVFGELDDFPAGHRRYWLKKDL